MGLTVAFARVLAKHAPLSLCYLMRVIASGDRASLQQATAWSKIFTQTSVSHGSTEAEIISLMQVYTWTVFPLSLSGGLVIEVFHPVPNIKYGPKREPR